MSPRCRLAVVLIAIASGALAYAAARQQPPPFRGGADIVQVDATVLDADGHFVTDLSADDFLITEDGRPQAIEAFYLVTGSRVAGGRVSDVSPERLRRVYVVVFDQLHLSSAGLKRTKGAARALFEKHFEDGDIGAVVSNGQLVNERLTSDRDELLRAVDAVRPAALAIRGFDQLSEYADSQNAEAGPGAKAMIDADDGRRTDLTLSSAAELMRNLETVEGRKTVLLMSEGFGDPARSSPDSNNFGLIRFAVGGARRANARVYAIDARGLVGGMANTLMDNLAVDTGGYVVRNENQLDASVAKIVAEAATYYVLGYHRPGPADGKFRSIDVRVKPGGLTVRARRGYLATP